MMFWQVNGIDRDTGDDVDGIITSAAEEEIPTTLSKYLPSILYFEVDEDELSDILSDMMLYTCEKITLFPEINYN